MQPRTAASLEVLPLAAARYSAIDALRGLIMILMAIDHSSAFIARQHASEFWAGAMSSYNSVFPFLTRWITHLCAPGFFFLMGAGVYWLAAGWREAGKSDGVIMRRVIGRGALLLAVGQVFETPMMFLQGLLPAAKVPLIQTNAPPPLDGSALWWGMLTLSGLGMVLMVCGLLIRLRPWAWLAVVALCVVATNSLLPASGKAGPLWLAILLAPGLSQHVIVIYPLVPWLAVAAAGMYFGYWWRRNPQSAPRQVWLLGVALLVIAVGLRAAGGWGNIRPPRDGSWIEFLNNVKYPPSLVFWTMSLGIDLLLLAVLVRLPEAIKSLRSPLIVFGQTPLFFYIAHFYLLAALGFAFFREAGSLQMAYAVWAGVIIALYPVCRWYRTFKLGKPRESLWRLF